MIWCYLWDCNVMTVWQVALLNMTHRKVPRRVGHNVSFIIAHRKVLNKSGHHMSFWGGGTESSGRNWAYFCTAYTTHHMSFCRGDYRDLRKHLGIVLPCMHYTSRIILGGDYRELRKNLDIILLWISIISHYGGGGYKGPREKWAYLSSYHSPYKAFKRIGHNLALTKGPKKSCKTKWA